MFELPSHKYKTFLSIYSLINTDLRAFKKSLKDKRLTNVEKKILTKLVLKLL